MQPPILTSCGATRPATAALRYDDDPEHFASKPPSGHTILVFDASDPVSHYGQARLLTGIQRVQIEAINAALRIRAVGSGPPIHVCCYIEGRDGWLEIPACTFQTITDLSPAWVTALNRLHLRLARTSPLASPHGATLVNLGTSWWLQNHFLSLRDAGARFGIRYVPLVYDLIPIIAPQYCIKNLTRDFISWGLGIFTHADAYLAISGASRADLVTVAATRSHAIDPDSIGVIPLDADFRKAGMTPAPLTTLSRWRLTEAGDVLLVSTVGSRKGHAVAFDAWFDLIDRLGPNAVPKLVCVGNRGWHNGVVYHRLQDSAVLASHVVMLSGIAKRCTSASTPSRQPASPPASTIRERSVSPDSSSTPRPPRSPAAACSTSARSETVGAPRYRPALRHDAALNETARVPLMTVRPSHHGERPQQRRGMPLRRIAQIPILLLFATY